MPKTGADFDSDAYSPVAERIALFYQRFPDGQILTRLISRRHREITFVARVFRTPKDTRPSATGWASERVDDGEVNAVACLENTETSAIGRALANLGFTASRQRPSAEEMAKAARARARIARAARDRDRGHDATLSALPVAARQVHEPRQRHYGSDARAALADATMDGLRLLRSAERLGLDERRAERLRERLRGGLSLASIERLEAVLRKWLIRHSGS